MVNKVFRFLIFMIEAIVIYYYFLINIQESPFKGRII